MAVHWPAIFHFEMGLFKTIHMYLRIYDLQIKEHFVYSSLFLFIWLTFRSNKYTHST